MLVHVYEIREVDMVENKICNFSVHLCYNCHGVKQRPNDGDGYVYVYSKSSVWKQTSVEIVKVISNRDLRVTRHCHYSGSV